MFKRIFSTFKHIPLRIWWPLATITPVLIFNRKHVFCQNKDSFINKFDIINILSSSKEEIVFVVCNRESIN